VLAGARLCAGTEGLTADLAEASEVRCRGQPLRPRAAREGASAGRFSFGHAAA
jgi:hypothetical protein